MKRKKLQTHIKFFDDLTPGELLDICIARIKVFVVEQNCPYQDIDHHDRASWHVWLGDDAGLAAYCRVLPAGETFEGVAIGRVITLRRGLGLGAKVLREGISVACEKFAAKTTVLEAQTYARGFYEKAGFVAFGEEFLEDDIPHIKMRLSFE